MNRLAVISGGDSPPAPSVAIAATFTFSSGTPITITSGDIRDLKNGIIHFAIAEPVVLGSLSDFVGWLTSKFGLPDINGQLDSLKKEIEDNPLLSSLYQGFLSFYNGIITIVVLSIDRGRVDSKTTYYSFQLAVTLDLVPPIKFFDFIEFDSIGVAVNTAGTSTSS